MVFLTFGDVLLTPANPPRPFFCRRVFATGLLSYHWWGNAWHKLSVTSNRLSRIFYNHGSLTGLPGRVVDLINFMEPDSRMLYLPSVPRLLSDNFYARLLEIAVRELTNESDHLCECKLFCRVDEKQTLRFGTGAVNITFSIESGKVDHLLH